MVVGRRPPKMKAEMGTPSGSSQSGSMVGHWLAGAVKRPLGWAAVGRLPCRSRASRVGRASRCSSAGGVSVMPSHQTPPSGVSATLVKMVLLARRGHGVGVGLRAGAGGDAEEAGLGIDGAEPAVGVGLDPGDVVADGPDLPALEAGGRDQHGEVGFAAGGGEGGGDVGLFSCRRRRRGFDAEDEHVLGHPALVAGDVGGDAQGEALLAEQGVAAVAGAVGPDLAGLGEVDDVLFVVAGPGDVLLAGREGRADGVHAGHDALLVLVDLGEDGSADAGHDAHVDDGVGGVGELDADLRHGRADGAHANGSTYMVRPRMQPLKSCLSLRRMTKGSSQLLVGPALSLEREQMKVRSSTRATSLGDGAGVEAAGPELLR